MNRISIELVPRNQESLFAAFELVKQHFPFINTVNIPSQDSFTRCSMVLEPAPSPACLNLLPHQPCTYIHLPKNSSKQCYSTI